MAVVAVFVSVSASVSVFVSHRCSKSEKSAVASSQLGLLKLAANRYTKRCVALRYNFEAASSLLASSVLFFFIFFFWDSAFRLFSAVMPRVFTLVVVVRVSGYAWLHKTVFFCAPNPQSTIPNPKYIIKFTMRNCSTSSLPESFVLNAINSSAINKIA